MHLIFVVKNLIHHQLHEFLWLHFVGFFFYDCQIIIYLLIMCCIINKCNCVMSFFVIRCKKKIVLCQTKPVCHYYYVFDAVVYNKFQQYNIS